MHVTEVTTHQAQRSDFARLERTLRVSIRLMQRSQREIRRKRTKEERGEAPVRSQQDAAIAAHNMTAPEISAHSERRAERRSGDHDHSFRLEP